MAESTYKKRDGANAIEGHWYEIKLILFMATFAQISNFRYRIASNIDEAGAFDDILCQYEYENELNYVLKKTIFVQTKHILSPENSKITKEEIFKCTKNKQGKFSLKKYFESYLSVKEKSDYFYAIGFDFLNADFIIYTNTTIDDDFMNYFELVDILVPINSAKSSKNSAYKIKQEYYQEFYSVLKGEQQDKYNFLQHLIFLVSQSNQQGVESLVKEKISKKFDEHNENDINDCFLKANEYVQNWWVKSGTVDILTHEYNIYQNCLSNMTCTMLKTNEENVKTQIKERKINFANVYIEKYTKILQSNQINEIITNNGETLLSLAKVLQCSIPHIFVNCDTVKMLESEVLCNFEKSTVKNMLVLLLKDYNNIEFISKIQNILLENKQKRLVYIREKNDIVTFNLDLPVNTIDDSKPESLYISDLTKKSVEKIHDAYIKVNGRDVKIGEIYHSNDIEKINLTIIAPVLLGKQIVVSNNIMDMKYVWNYYISRTLSQNTTISTTSLKQCTSDYFLIVGSTSDFQDNIYFHSDKYYPEHSVEHKHIYLHTNEVDAEHSYKELCQKYKNNNVHMLKLVNNKCSWIKTYGSIHNILNMKKNNIQENERFSEKELVIRCNAQKTTIISNIAGMGKTILVQKLAQEIVALLPTICVHIIELNQFKRKFSPPKTSESIVQYLLRLLNISDILQKEVFITMYNTGNVAIIFDGFDELGYELENYLAKFLLKLKESKVKQIYITCRSNKEEYLEKTLGILSYRLNELSDCEQESFLANHWLNSQKCTDQKKTSSELLKLSRCLIKQLNTVKTENDEQICAIPLHLRMLAEIYYEPNEEVQNITRPENIGKIPNNLSKLYNLFIEKKITLAFNEKMAIPQAELIIDKDENIIHSHELLAISILFSEEEQKFIFTEEDSIKRRKLIKNNFTPVYYYGLLADMKNNNMRYIHQTFTEYFAASYFFRKQNRKQSKLYNIFMVKHLLIDEKFVIIRKFINGMVANDNSKEAGIRNFPFKLITKEKGFKSFSSLNPIHISSAENNISLLDLFLKSMTKKRQVKGLIKLTDQDGKNSLYHAAENGNLEIVKYLFNIGSDLNIQDSNGRSILETSAYSGNWQLFTWLVTNGASFEESRSKFSLFLSMARFTGSPEVFDWLIKNGADDTYVENSGDTPLHEVARSENLELIDWYLARGADINAKNHKGNTVLMEAVIEERVGTVFSLIEKNADVNICNKNGNSIIHIFIESYSQTKCSELITTCLQKGVDINVKSQANGNTALHMAIIYKRKEIIKLLINNKSDVNVVNNEDETPLLLAMTYKDYEAARLLIENGASPNYKFKNGSTLLHKFSADKKVEDILWLISHGAKVNDTDMVGETIFHITAKFGVLDNMKLLNSKGANLHLRDNYGNSAAMIAAQYGKLEVLKWLIDNGSNINDRNKRGDSILMTATRFGKTHVSYWLLKQNADISLKNKDDDTVLSIAIQLDQYVLVKDILIIGAKNQVSCDSVLQLIPNNGGIPDCNWLLDIGVDKDLQNKTWDTAIRLAAKYSNLEVVRTLFIHGAYIAFKNKKGISDIHLAAENNKYEMVSWLVEQGANINEVNKNGDTVLLIAAKNNHLQGIIQMLKIGACPHTANNLGNTIIHIAVENRNIDMLDYLIRNISDIDITFQNHAGYNILMIATEIGELKIFRYLITRFTHIIEAINVEGNTCLTIAARCGHFDELLILLSFKANINHKNYVGDSVLNVAIRAEQYIVAYKLLMEGALFDQRNNKGVTALTISAKLGNLELVKILVNKGAEISNVDFFGNTLLHHVATSHIVNESCKNYPKENIITYLIENGVNISVKNKKYESVLDIANKYGNKDIILMLSKYFKWLQETYIARVIDKYILLHYPNSK